MRLVGKTGELVQRCSRYEAAVRVHQVKLVRDMRDPGQIAMEQSREVASAKEDWAIVDLGWGRRDLLIPD